MTECTGPATNSVPEAFRIGSAGRALPGTEVRVAPDGNALDVAKAVKQRMKELEAYFPAGVSWDVPYDTSPFVEISITEVVHTLFEAMALVFLVMWLCLD